MAGEFWLDDDQWTVISPLLSTNQPSAHRTDDRRVISGIIHVLRSGCRWQDCPSCYWPSITVYSRLHHWSAKGIWWRLFEALVQTTDQDIHMIDSTTAKAHRSAAGGKGRQMPQQSVDRLAADREKSMLLSMVAAVQSRCEQRLGNAVTHPVAILLLEPLPPTRLCAASTAYDSDALRSFLTARGTKPVISNYPTQKGCDRSTQSPTEDGLSSSGYSVVSRTRGVSQRDSTSS